MPPGPGFVHGNRYTPDAVIWEHETTKERVVQTSRDKYHRGEVPPSDIDSLAAQSHNIAAQALNVADLARSRANQAWDETEGLRLLVHALAALSGLAVTFSAVVLVLLITRL